MNLRGFLKQETLHQPKSAETEWGASLYGPARVLPARVEEKQRRVLNASGNEVLSETRVMLVDEVKVGDLLDGSEVQARESIVDVGGQTLGYTVYL